MSDLERLRREYQKRKEKKLLNDRYSIANPAYRFALTQRESRLSRILIDLDKQLNNCICLEVGCGSGGVLQEYQSLGVNSDNLFGIDFLFDRLQACHTSLPSAGISNADGQDLPFPQETFDLVLQYTAFTSILDDLIKHHMAAEMLRVLKPDGLIIWYDFWWNPTNPQTRGIRPAEIRSLFPNCTFDFRKTTLAPPIARRVVPISWGLSLFLESLGIFNSHYLVVIRK